MNAYRTTDLMRAAWHHLMAGKPADLPLQRGHHVELTGHIKAVDTTAMNANLLIKAFKLFNVTIELQQRLVGKTHVKSPDGFFDVSPVYRQMFKNDETGVALRALPPAKNLLPVSINTGEFASRQIKLPVFLAKFVLLGASLVIFPALSSAAQYGCPDIVQRSDEVFMQGSDGVFFRQKPDLDIFFPISDRSAAFAGDLTRTLAKKGISLVMLPIPARGTVMSTKLATTSTALTLGFDPEVARISYEDYIGKLRSNGVAALDLLPVLTADGAADPLFMKSDHHWTAGGAEATAKVLAANIATIENFVALPKAKFVTKPIGTQLIISNMRRAIQLGCADAVPKNEALASETAHETEAAQESAVDIFGDDSTGSAIALVGTSFSDVDAFNFDGYISQYSGVDVANFAISGGNQFVSILSYLTSPAFIENPPKVIVWENPVYNDLGEFGDAPFDELIAAASGACEGETAQKLMLTADASGNQSAQLPSMPRFKGNSYIKFDAGNPSVRRAAFAFKTADGGSISSEILRADRFKANGRFYVKLPAANIKTVNITATGADASQNSISLCSIADE